MSANLWFISDTHFSHRNMVDKFKREDGSSARDFESVEAMDECMVERWNGVVRPQDHIYHLGDVAMTKQAVDAIMPRLNGHKRLVRGNHDIFQTKLYLKYFEHIYGCRVLDGFIFTHVPIHPECMGRFKANVHGHTHYQQLNQPYINVCVEHTYYRPVSLDEIIQRVK